MRHVPLSQRSFISHTEAPPVTGKHPFLPPPPQWNVLCLATILSGVHSEEDTETVSASSAHLRRQESMRRKKADGLHIGMRRKK